MNSAANMLSVRDQVSAEEWQLRVDLAACYRLVAMYGWDDLVFTHISARVPGPEEHFLINAYGLMFEEMTASSLVKVDLTGNIVMETPYPVNPAGFTIHSAVHEARQDIACVLHTHTRAGVAVSAQAGGLLPISQVSLFPLMSIGYHDYEGVALNAEEKPRLVADLGSHSCLILRNHGLLTVGPTIADAFLIMYTLETACQTQLLAQSAGTELIRINPAILKGIAAQAREVTKGLGGQLAWPGLLRKLERQDNSFRE
jgi:ribulose-5-phosphate 4-epimerase/fuculose-1-phosphate aldolase